MLALETATRAVGVALLRGEELVAERAAPAERPAAETLLPALDALLAEAGVGLDAVDALAVSAGPGSFTGLRIGIATAKGLALVDGIPVVPVSTLAALALGAGPSCEPVVAALDARRGEVYAGCFAWRDGEPAAQVAEGVYTPGELAAALPPRCTAVGEGLSVCGDALREALGGGLTIPADAPAEPRARDVGRLAVRALARGAAVDAAEVVPRYLRRAEAEVKRTGARFQPVSSTP